MVLDPVYTELEIVVAAVQFVTLKSEELSTNDRYVAAL
jgi:hypothetical protein